MLDDHYVACAAALANLNGLAYTSSMAGGGTAPYLDLITALEWLHDPDDLPYVDDLRGQPRDQLYAESRAALLVLRDRQFVDPLEAGLLVHRLDAAWAVDPGPGQVDAR